MAGSSVKRVPVGRAIAAIVDLQGTVMAAIMEEFQGGPGVPEQEYRLELDPEPSLADFARLMKEIGRQSLEKAARTGTAQAEL
mmetsp:Transcript_20208/g.63500  ORF Transcript_20208/g.63500 Transcript_20208/m.63500 type:complete len:83 (+) Transcript_20208:2-250(+)